MREHALELAGSFALKTLKFDDGDARDYAENNWGTFAAMHLVDSGRHPGVLRSTNHLWN